MATGDHPTIVLSFERADHRLTMREPAFSAAELDAADRKMAASCRYGGLTV